jgi:hypothetical protein
LAGDDVLTHPAQRICVNPRTAGFRENIFCVLPGPAGFLPVPGTAGKISGAIEIQPGNFPAAIGFAVDAGRIFLESRSGFVVPGIPAAWWGGAGLFFDPGRIGSENVIASTETRH